jgi:Rrp15p
VEVGDGAGLAQKCGQEESNLSASKFLSFLKTKFRSLPFSKMAPLPLKRRKVEDGMQGKIMRPKKRVRKQKEYHSSSEDSEGALEDGFTPFNLADSDDEGASKDDAQTEAVDDAGASTGAESGEYEDEELSGGDEHGDDGNAPRDNTRPTSKRNDPEAFSTSISKILSTKLSQGLRRDPVLSRSREAADVSSTIANDKLERRAKAKIRADKKEELERGRVKDVLGLKSGRAGEVAEEEKRLRKIAQRGVVKLFNAVRAAQVKGEEAAREARKKGTVGYANREEKINEMSKQGFLDLINGSGKNKPIEEAR